MQNNLFLTATQLSKRTYAPDEAYSYTDIELELSKDSSSQFAAVGMNDRTAPLQERLPVSFKSLKKIFKHFSLSVNPPISQM